MHNFLFILSFLFLSCSAEKINKADSNEVWVKESIKKEIPPINNCICTSLYDPVCGNDGENYSNQCYAECAQITEFTMGECETKETP